MKQELAQIPIGELEIRQRIKTIRGIQVMLDWDIAELYGVETRSLNQAVKRNMERFPPNFRFHLTKNELSEAALPWHSLGIYGTRHSYAFGCTEKPYCHHMGYEKFSYHCLVVDKRFGFGVAIS